ncbi:MATE family efflux transporter [Vibrio sp. Vb339]|uniref:MATE family efflux transporter n=1 Tax=Vibrio sp. Vb339 TaxID=1192013 RepID=UPI001555F7AA|nr:polysaccharide biosynthesis C-terminal domain-containing protein [Vibrio sp. Vb339]
MSLVVANTTEVNHAGVFFFSLALIQLGGGLLTLGSPNALLKVVGADYGVSWKCINQDVSVVIKCVFGLSLAIMFVSVVFPTQISAALGMPEVESILPAIALAMLAFALVQIFSAMLQGKQHAIMASTVQNVVAQFSFILILGLATWLGITQTSVSLVYVYLFAISLAMAVGGVIWFRANGASFEIEAKLSPELKVSLSALFVTMLMGQCSMWAGQFSTAKFLSSSDVAFFASTLRTATLASFVLIAVNLVVAPKFAQAFAKGNSGEVNKLSLLSSRLMMLMATPVLAFMTFFPEFLMGLFGEEYKVAAPLLQILAIGQFINVITGSVGYLLNMTGHEKDMRNVVLFSGPLAIVLAFGLTSQFGLMGAAYATAISVATQNLLAVWMVKKRLGFNTLNVFRKV